MCVTHWQALWWVRLRPGSDDSSKLNACLWLQGIFVLILILLFFQTQGSDIGLVGRSVSKILVLFSCGWFDPCLEWTETIYYGRDTKALLI